MKTTIGQTRFTLQASERDGQWLARAARDDNGDPFGIECAGATEAEAIARLTAWLEWQSEHTAALEALQQAEGAHHPTIARGARAGARPRDRPRSRCRRSRSTLSKARACGSTRFAVVARNRSGLRGGFMKL